VPSSNSGEQTVRNVPKSLFRIEALLPGTRSSLGPLYLCVAAVFLLCAAALAQRPPLKEEKVGDGVLVTVLPPDKIPALTKPVFVSGVEADRQMADDEPVLGLVDPVTGQAKAYSLWHLEHHEIVNDQLGGKPVAVTW